MPKKRETEEERVIRYFREAEPQVAEAILNVAKGIVGGRRPQVMVKRVSRAKKEEPKDEQ